MTASDRVEPHASPIHFTRTVALARGYPSITESPGTLKIHQVNLSKGTHFKSNFTPEYLCQYGHMTMAICSPTLGKVTGDLSDVARLILASETH